MKKILTICLAVYLSSIVVWANIAQFPGAKNQLVKGGEEGRNYAAIITTASSTSHKDQIKAAVDFLVNYSIVDDADEVMKLINEYDDTQKELTIPIDLRCGFHTTAPVMGAAAVMFPLMISMDLQIQFFESGSVRLIFKNLKDYSFVPISSIYNSCEFKLESLFDENSENYNDKLVSYYSAASTSVGMGKVITDILVWANSGLEESLKVSNAIDEFLSGINDQFDLMESLCEKGFFKLMSNEDELDAYKDAIAKNDLLPITAASTKKQYEYAVQKNAQNYMLNVSEYSWGKELKNDFNILIALFCQCMDGKLTGIAQDGIQTWELVDDKLLPVDAKLRKSFLKSGLDYMSYYE